MKNMKSARDVALQILLKIEREQAYSNLALQNELSMNRQLNPQDRALVTELVYGTIQRLYTIDRIIGRFLKQPLHKMEPDVRNVLRMSTYQLVFLDRIPAFAAIHEAVEIIKRKKQRASGFVNGVLRNIHRAGPSVFDEEFTDPIERLAFATSHPIWLIKQWVKQYGVAVTEQICLANLQRSHVTLRVNTLRISPADCLAKLQAAGLNVVQSGTMPQAIHLRQGLDISTLAEFKTGLVTVQDESSMLVAYCLQAKPGMHVLDACAAPGGKTTHIAEQMQDQGFILACDIHPHKIDLIHHVKERLDLHSVHPVVSDMRDIGKEQTFDRILLDAPCSGLGVLRRKPDIKWSKAASDVRELILLQEDLLQHAARLVNQGGVMVYSTCTLNAKENQQQISKFLQSHPDFVLDSVFPYVPEHVKNYVSKEGWLEILPQYFDSDGFFIARLRKV